MTKAQSRLFLFGVFFIFSVVLLFSGCDSQDEKPVNVSLSSTGKHEPLKQEPLHDEAETKSLRIAIAAVISPEKTLVLYKDLLKYISVKTALPVQLVQRETYEEINNLIRDHELDLAFVCSGAYVTGHEECGLELLVAPLAFGKSVYHAYIIVPAASDAGTLEDLRGKVFAFTDPMSNTGKLVPTYMLSRMNEDIDSFFSDYLFTYSHDRSIEMVAYQLVDGASVDGLIWEYVNSTNPALAAQTKIIQKSEPYGIPPVVVPAGLDSQLKEKLRTIFLNLHLEEEGKNILTGLHIDRFVIIDDSSYDSVRKMQSWVDAR